MLLATDKIVFIKHVRDMAQWPVYLIIGNLSHQIRSSRSRARGMIVGLIPIHKRDSLEVKIEIHHQTMVMITKDIFKSLFLCIVVCPGTSLEKAVVEGLLMMCADRSVRRCHTIIVDMSINYKEQVVITGIKAGMQYSMC